MNDFVKSVLLGRRAPPSKIGVDLEKSGAIRVDVEGFLLSDEGQNDVKRAQQLWERLHPVKDEA